MVSLGVNDGPVPDEIELIDRCKAGDRAAWQAFYQVHFTFVLRSARRLGILPNEVEDVTQEVFTVAFRKLSGFHEGKVTTWLYRICANVVSDHHRRRRVRQAFAHLFAQGPHEERTPESELSQREAETQVARILGRLRPKHRVIFTLFEIEGLSGEEIAERVGCPTDTVWTRLFHARNEFARFGNQARLFEAARAP